MGNNCWFFHKWGKWEPVAVTLVGSRDFVTTRELSVIKLKRICARCGLVQYLNPL